MAPVHPTRIHDLNDREVDSSGEYVLYWMQSAQRAEWNDALEHAITCANESGVPLLTVFGLTDDYPEAVARHYQFVLEGLSDVAAGLDDRNIGFVVRRGAPPDVVLDLVGDATQVITDVGYLRQLRAWRGEVASGSPVLMTEVESDVVVPVEVASSKREYAARTFRPRVNKHRDDYLVELDRGEVDVPWSADLAGFDVSDPEAALAELDVDTSVAPVPSLYPGGRSRGLEVLESFLHDHMDHYDDLRNQPQTSAVSYMSMFLHYGHLSPVEVALAVLDSGGPAENVDSYLEELIVRRELGFNYVHYEKDYDSYDALPEWARKTLAEHEDDDREYVYSEEELVAAETHDPYWNASMVEMRDTGYMHNYMRMYWGKKILEWSPSPREGFETTLRLNNRFFLDGRDPASFANVAWVYGLHDRPWQEREIFGKVRYMSAGGLERKAKPDEYIVKVESLAETAQGD